MWLWIAVVVLYGLGAVMTFEHLDSYKNTYKTYLWVAFWPALSVIALRGMVRYWLSGR